MKKVFFLLIFIVSKVAFGQGGTWTWISGVPGVSGAGSAGVYGTQGVPAVNNHPPSIYEPGEWKDKQGNFWIFGGWQLGSSISTWSDLWKYNLVSNEWTWMKGNGLVNDSAIKGTKGVANSSNTPGGITNAVATWVDTSGNFWLFGGAYPYPSYQDPMYQFYLNNLWKYDVASNNWTWMSGVGGVSGVIAGVYGTQGIPSPSNMPGARSETCSAWTDSLNNLWLFGGLGNDINGIVGELGDLWKYNIHNNEWTWMKGSDTFNSLPVYGAIGVPSPTSDPGSRWSYTKWKDSQSNFWLMGGGYDDFAWEYLNDVWKYDLSVNEWANMTGAIGQSGGTNMGRYEANCVFDTLNVPYSRLEHRSSVTDNCGRFWMFGGTIPSNYHNFLNDLWVYDPQTLNWNWISGTNSPNQTGSYGLLGVPAPTNMPPSRMGAVAWWGNDNKFYMFGGGASDSYYSDLWVFNPDTNCVQVCNAAAVLPPVASFSASGTTICANDCIKFTDLSANNPTVWKWNFQGGSPATTTDRNPQVCYSDSGIYNVTLIASNSTGSDTLIIHNYITVKPSPPPPSILDHHGINKDTLICTANASYKSYQWYLDSALIPNATDTLVIVSKSGNYNVEVTGANGCKIAVGINIIIGLQNYMKDYSVTLFPNPVGDKFTVYGLPFTVGRIDIYNTLGQVVQRSSLLWRGVGGEADVSALSSGIYFVQLTGEKERWVGRFVKE